jgi:hypothetical protein
MANESEWTICVAGGVRGGKAQWAFCADKEYSALKRRVGQVKDAPRGLYRVLHWSSATSAARGWRSRPALAERAQARQHRLVVSDILGFTAALGRPGSSAAMLRAGAFTTTTMARLVVALDMGTTPGAIIDAICSLCVA